MDRLFSGDGWTICESGFNPAKNRIAESVFSLGNGHMGMRGNFEETYSGDTLKGTYVAGIYYPDRTRVGWWKIGYPEYFAKVLNSTDWIGLEITVGNERLDLATWTVTSFERVLNMQAGVLSRRATASSPRGTTVEIETRRFVSLHRPEIGVLRYTLTARTDATIEIGAFLDGRVKNEDANYDEIFWDFMDSGGDDDFLYVHNRTRKTGFDLYAGLSAYCRDSSGALIGEAGRTSEKGFAARRFSIDLEAGGSVTVYKTACFLTSRDYETADLAGECRAKLIAATAAGFAELESEHTACWETRWRDTDIVVDGDEEIQQGLRFTVFQLNQTYTGHDERLNIGPKGFTGEKYGGGTYWDTEAYCLPYYLGTNAKEVARNLLLYRHRQLGKAIENAEKLGFSDGAALYPMVTMNGEECHNEWEITFEEIHRNGAIAWAIYQYTRSTGDREYLYKEGIEVLIGLSRFWRQRAQFSAHAGEYVILGVTGPNEYENNVNNNWYTNYVAAWTLRYTAKTARELGQADPERFDDLCAALSYDPDTEGAAFEKIADGLRLPYDPQRAVFLQQDGYLDKDLAAASTIPPEERPINKHWSWDRILRSCFIKQADVLQGMFFFFDEFDEATIRRNFDFYEPMCVHESSLSPCVHTILAARLGYDTRATELLRRTARLDLDNINDDTDDGLHITSMAGSWLSIAYGLAGMRLSGDKLVFEPVLPPEWKSYAFRTVFRGRTVEVHVDEKGYTVKEAAI